MKRLSAWRPVLALAMVASPCIALAQPAQSDLTSHLIDASLQRPRDLSLWSMFLGADIVVKAVIAGLLFASLVTWTVLIAKSIEISRAAHRVRIAIGQLSEARGLAQARLALGASSPIASALIAEATRELRLSSDAVKAASVKERVASSYAEIERAEGMSISRGTGLLASIGSTGPFVGLFGTVWGIMNGFIGISKAQTTNLAVVAPGIAEALLATAVGLFAAIPAVLFYNHLARSTGAYLELVSNLSGELLRVLSRDLDRGAHAENKIQAAE
ncbi:MAG: tonB-system energizer ExbB [Beijerinckiaceae bacterium]|nr:tonB-system energizer ExbB [Beijerinckiaceae bacterium]MCI0735489.1 tonB-system energizer ExbB [Beijerinckiaceae bacterium]